MTKDGPLVYYKLTLLAKGSGELKMEYNLPTTMFMTYWAFRSNNRDIKY